MAEHVKFLFNTEWMVNIRKLKDKEKQLDLFYAIVDYAETRVHAELPFDSDLVIEPIKSEIERYQSNYKQKCETNRQTALTREQRKREEAEELARLRALYGEESGEHERAQSCTDVDACERLSPPKPKPKPKPKPEPEPEVNGATSSACDVASDITRQSRAEKQQKTLKAKEIVDYYNKQVLEKHSRMVSCERLTDKRKGHILARISEFGEEGVKRVIDTAIGSNFFEVVAKNSVANLDWLMLPSNFEKVLQGNYKDRPAPQHSGRSNYNEQSISDIWKQH